MTSKALFVGCWILGFATPAIAATPVLVDPSLACAGRTAGVDCFATIQEAVNNAGPAPAVVEILAGTYAESVDLNLMGSALIAGVPGDLTVEGIGVGIAKIDPVTGFAIFADTFPGGVTLRNLEVTSPNVDAIRMFDGTGNILLESIRALGAAFDGADIGCDGTITLRNSNFDGNGNDGAEIKSNGDVLIESCTANDNIGAFVGDDGFNITVRDGDVTITGSRADRNGGEGFEIHPFLSDTTGNSGRIGKVTIRDSHADSNGRRGILPGPQTGTCDEILNDYPNTIMADGFQIESCGVPDQNGNIFPFGTVAGDPGTIADVEITNSTSTNNSQDGFELEVFGAVVLADVRAENNGFLESGDGIDITGFQFFDFSAPPMQQNDWFSAISVVGERLTILGNADDGFVVAGDGSFALTPSTTVVLTDVTANSNGNRIPFALGFPPPADLWESLPGQPFCDGSGEEGIDIQNVASVSCTRCTANDNGHSGMSIEAPVIVGDTLWASGNRETGIELQDARGAPDSSVECTDCISNANGEHGFHVSARTVSIDGCEASFSAAQDGLDVFDSPGDGQPDPMVTIRNCRFVGNHEQGMDVHDYGGASGSVLIENVCARENGIGMELQSSSAPHVVRNSQFLSNRLHGVRFERTTSNVNQITGSNLVGNGRSGLFFDEVPNTHVLSAGNNWWGDSSGPTHPNNAGGTGDGVFDFDNAIDPVNGGNGIVDFVAPAQAELASLFSCDSPTPTPTSTPTSTPTDTPTQTPTASPTGTATATSIPDGGACANSSQCSVGAECINNVCVRPPTPAPAASSSGLIGALVALIAIALVAVWRRQGS